MSVSRRQFMQRSAVAAMSAALPLRLSYHQAPWYPWLDRDDDRHRLARQAGAVDPSVMRALAARALEAARAAGATYADVRLTRTVNEQFAFPSPDNRGAFANDQEQLGVGVRALVNGYWGFAASPYWVTDEMSELAQAAVTMAKANALGTPREVSLGTIPAPVGTWSTPIRLDPFAVPIEEKIDFMNAWRQAADDTRGVPVLVESSFCAMEFKRQERYVASTEGMDTMQTLYMSGGSFQIGCASREWRKRMQGQSTGMLGNGTDRQGKGWELFLDAKLRDQIPALMDEAAATMVVPRKPVQIGRFDVVFDATTTAAILTQTVGIATQLDRALGFEANGGGTSYLGPDPLTMLGTFQVGAPSFTVTANRSLPNGLATVGWDDEGVVPRDFTLVKDGVLTDYQTTREQAAWIAPWYQKQGRAVQSNACAAADSALSITMQMAPNLAMAPSATSTSFDDLVANTTRGFAITRGFAATDAPARNGWGFGRIREINNGKLGAFIQGAGYLFTSTELWKNLVGIGGANSVAHVATSLSKGQPEQEVMCTVSAVPGKFKNVSIFDVMRNG